MTVYFASFYMYICAYILYMYMLYRTLVFVSTLR